MDFDKETDRILNSGPIAFSDAARAFYGSQIRTSLRAAHDAGRKSEEAMRELAEINQELGLDT